MNDDHFKNCLDTGHVNVFSELSVAEEICTFFRFSAIRVGKILRTLSKGIGFNEVFSLETAPPGNLHEDLFEKFFSLYARLANDLPIK